jgi:periplasmic copper chaperone A
MNVRNALALAACIGLVQAAHAQVTVSHSWVKATVPGQKVGAAYMELKSTESAALVSAASPAAGVTEVHEMKMEGGVMKMRAVERIELPAGETVKLEPGGYHVMLMGLRKPLKAGEMVPITLTVETSDKKRHSVRVQAPVRESGPSSPPHMNMR